MRPVMKLCTSQWMAIIPAFVSVIVLEPVENLPVLKLLSFADTV